jgi:hypothetical protein
MWQRIILGLLLAAAAYAVVKYFSKDGFINMQTTVELPGPSPYVREPMPRGDMAVSSGGPNPPNVESTQDEVYVPPAQASDPYEVTTASADAPENLRHPERSFGPGIEPANNSIREEAGLAGPPSVSPQAFQQFSPEQVTNGGSFFGAVSAMENENPNYSAF